MKKNNFKKAFTIPELLVIIAVIGIVASSLVLVWVQDARAKARDAKRVSDLDTVRTALKLYYMDNKEYPVETGWCSIEQTDESINAKCPNTDEICLKCAELNEKLKPYLSQIPGDSLFGQGKEPKDIGGRPLKIFSYMYNSDLGTAFRLKADLEKSDEKLEFFGGAIDPADIISGGNMPPPAPRIEFFCDQLDPLNCYINENEGFATITIKLSNFPPGGYGNPKVSYYTDDPQSTASPVDDYTSANGNLEFDGVDTVFFTVRIIDDTEMEPQETIRLVLKNPINASFYREPCFVDLRIIDDDQNRISFNPSVYDKNEDAGKIEASVVFEGGAPAGAYVHYYTGDGTALGGPGRDFQSISDLSPLRLDFEEGETIATFTIDIYEDLILEGTEYFYLKLTDNSHGTLGQETAQVNIIDNDSLSSFIRIIHGSNDLHGLDNTDVFYSVQTTSGGYIMAGKTKSGGIGYFDFPELIGDIFVTKLPADLSASNGWAKIIGSSVFDRALAIETLDDDSYILTGESAAEGNRKYDIPLIRLDSSGAVLENKIIKFSEEGDYYNSGRDIVKTIDGGFVLVGTTEGRSRTQEEILVVKFDQGANIEWAKTISKPTYNLRGYSIEQVPTDESYVLTGTIQSKIGFPSYPDIVLIKINKLGDNIDFQTQISGGQYISGPQGGDGDGRRSDIGNSVAVNSDGSFVVVGSTDSFEPHFVFEAPLKSLYLLKFNPDGSFDWNRKISGGSAISGEAYSVFESKDRNYIINGYIKKDTDVFELYTAKIRPDGSISWDRSKNIDRDYGTGNYIYDSSKELPDGGFMVVGQATSTSVFPPPPDNAFIAKFTSEGELECPSAVQPSNPSLGSADLFHEETDPQLNLINIDSPESFFHDCSFIREIETIILSENPC